MILNQRVADIHHNAKVIGDKKFADFKGSTKANSLYHRLFFL